MRKRDREGADRVEQNLSAMLAVMVRSGGCPPPVVRTAATENKGIDVLAETIATFRKHFEASGERQRKHVEHWKLRLIEMLESRLLQRAVVGAGGEKRLGGAGVEVAAANKDTLFAGGRMV